MRTFAHVVYVHYLQEEGQCKAHVCTMVGSYQETVRPALVVIKTRTSPYLVRPVVVVHYETDWIPSSGYREKFNKKTT